MLQYHRIGGQQVPHGTDIIFRLQVIDSGIVGVEICEDLWVPLSPHEFQALAGATALITLSASNEILSQADWRRVIISSESGRCIAACYYISSGIGEPSNDVVYSGHALLAENGVILQESERLTPDSQLAISDINIQQLAHDRRVLTSFRDMAAQVKAYRVIETEVSDPHPERLERMIDPHPFVPMEPARRVERCRKIFSMQVAALAQKLVGAKRSQPVLGVSAELPRRYRTSASSSGEIQPFRVFD